MFSAGIDLKNPQFENAPASTDMSNTGGQAYNSGDHLAGAGLSAQAITPKLSPAARIFSSKSFESVSNNYSTANNLLAFNGQSPAAGITANSIPSTNLSSVNNVSQIPASINSANLGGLHAKALSLNSVLPKAPHAAIAPSNHGLAASHKHIANNPFLN